MHIFQVISLAGKQKKKILLMYEGFDYIPWPNQVTLPSAQLG